MNILIKLTSIVALVIAPHIAVVDHSQSSVEVEQEIVDAELATQIQETDQDDLK